VAWNLRYPAYAPIQLKKQEHRWDFGPGEVLVAPGKYAVRLSKRVNGKRIPLGPTRHFRVKALGKESLPVEDRQALVAFQQKAGRLQRAVQGSAALIKKTLEEIKFIQKALDNTPDAEDNLAIQIQAIKEELLNIQQALIGDSTRSLRAEVTSPPVAARIGRIVDDFWLNTAPATTTHKRNYEVAAREFSTILKSLHKLMEQDFTQMERDLEKAAAPWTPARGVPDWQPE
jgi:hypothetical protein